MHSRQPPPRLTKLLFKGLEHHSPSRENTAPTREKKQSAHTLRFALEFVPTLASPRSYIQRDELDVVLIPDGCLETLKCSQAQEVQAACGAACPASRRGSCCTHMLRKRSLCTKLIKRPDNHPDHARSQKLLPLLLETQAMRMAPKISKGENADCF